MSELGDLLELVHGADATFNTLRARYRVWRHHERLNAAFLADARRAGGSVVQAAGREPGSAESEEIVSIWRQAPDRARVERQGGGTDSSFGVRNGEQWWSWAPRSGAVSNSEDPSVGSEVGDEFATLLHPHVLLAALRLVPLGTASRARRPVIVAKAEPRGAPLRSVNVGLALLELGRGADHYRLEFDAEQGIVLAAGAFRAEEAFLAIEALDVGYDESLADSLFDFRPPPAEHVRQAGMRYRIHRHLSVAEAQAAAPFTILIPRKVPRGWRMRCTYFAGSDRPPSPPSVGIIYRSDAADEGLSITETPASSEHPLDYAPGWHDVVAGEQTVRILGRDDTFPQAQLTMERDGTRIFMISETLSSDDLVAMARLLRPAAEPD